MAVKKKNKSNKKLLSIIGVICAIFICLLTIWKSYEFVAAFLFTSNEHFIVKDVIPEDTLLWKNKSDDLSVLLEITKGETNIFNVNLTEGRKRLELQSDIASVSVYRELPDTIRVAIKDRTPRAVVEYNVTRNGEKRKDWRPLDINGVVMSKESTLGRESGLPRIIGCKFDKKIVEGKELDVVKPALEIIRLILSTTSTDDEPAANKPFTITSGGQKKQSLLKVDTISLGQKDVIKFVVKLRGLSLRQPFVVTINSDDKIKESFVRMRKYVLDLILKQSLDRRVDLRFDGVVPTRKL